MIEFHPSAPFVFVSVFCWFLALSTTSAESAMHAKGLRCWSNMESRHKALNDMDEAQTGEKRDEEKHEGALALLDHEVEEACKKGTVCGEYEIFLNIRNKESYFDLKGCVPYNTHDHVCKMIMDKLDGIGGGEEDENDCQLSAYYCIEDLCNTSNVGKTIGIVVGVMLAVLLLAVLLYIVFDFRSTIYERYRYRFGNANVNASNSDNDNGGDRRRNSKSDKRSRSRSLSSKSREYRPIPPADGVGNESFDEVAIPKDLRES